ncbi:MAG: aspartate--tRNA ligase [Clostridiales bacterium]|nr:aspartate--tRNA ligase [Clostridiales bacterium]
MYRTHNCNELRESDVNKEVKIAGWLYSIRDLGAVIFFVVRDFYGITQVTVSDEEMKEQVRKIPRESTISVQGKVILRSSPNPDISTGLIEIEPKKIEILGKCIESLPFEVAASLQSREDTRLKYRFLDLRNPLVKDNIVLRSKIISTIRRIMTEKGFLEIQTPILTSSSPEGARDYIVPSRLYPGKFYALPQAPQIYKQLLMTSGFDKYFQIAPCFRDEDARADRSPGEFYQLDIEMCFATQEDVFRELEDIIPRVFAEHTTKKIDSAPFRRITYRDAMENYGSDKPDLRNPLLIKNVSDLLTEDICPLFANKLVYAVSVDGFNKNRKYIESLTEFVAERELDCSYYWFRVDASGNLLGGVSKFLHTVFDSLKERLGLKPNTFVALVAGEKGKVNKCAGYVRNELGNAMDLIEKNAFRFCWIVDFPMYELNEETNTIDFSHNPFSMPQGGLEALMTKNPLDIFAYQYDIVCNGVELSSGAVRNHDPKTMVKAFEIAGYDESVIEEKFSALYNAFKFGAPPHAGIAPGVDRMVMLLADQASIREVIAFPMNKNAQDLLMGAPSTVTDIQLKEANISVVYPDKEKE